MPNMLVLLGQESVISIYVKWGKLLTLIAMLVETS